MSNMSSTSPPHVNITTEHVNTSQGAFSQGGFTQGAFTHPADIIYSSPVENYVIAGILNSVTCLVGVVGNVFSLVILTRPAMRSPINMYLLWLGVVDTVLLACSWFGFSLPALYSPRLRYFMSFHHPHVVKWIYPLALIAQTASVWLTVAVTIERYIAVRHPLKARSWCTMTKAKISIATVGLVSALYNIPRFFETDVTYLESYGLFYAQPSSFREDQTYMEVYYVAIYIPVMVIIPFGALAILNFTIWLTVQRAKKERSRMSRSREKEMNTAMMLVVIVVIFFVTNSPAAVLNCFENVMNRYPTVKERFAAFFKEYGQLTAGVSNLLVAINSSVNFFVYAVFGKKFRDIFLVLFCKCCPRNLEFDDAMRYTVVYRSTPRTPGGGGGGGATPTPTGTPQQMHRGAQRGTQQRRNSMDGLKAYTPLEVNGQIHGREVEIRRATPNGF